MTLRLSRVIAVILLSVALTAMTACGRETSTLEPEALRPSLERVRSSAVRALDEGLRSSERSDARDHAMTSLLALLRHPDSLEISQIEWETPLEGFNRPLLNFFPSGSVRVFAMALPASGVVPPGERVAVQYLPASGPPQAFELEVLPGAMLVAARALQTKPEEIGLTLAFSLMRGGGYVGYYERESKTGNFQLSPAAFENVPNRIGDLSLEIRDNVLVAASPLDSQWWPRFDTKQALRLFLNVDVALDWKEGFVLHDERNQSAFQSFAIAYDTSREKPEREEAWEKAVRKLPAYLEEPNSWADKLQQVPRGATVKSDETPGIAARLISLPAPQLDDTTHLSIVQYRVGNGLPSSQEIELPGVAEAFRLVIRQGLPGLMIVSGSPGGASAGLPVQKQISLFQLTAGNSWEPAPSWFGFMPSETGYRLSLPDNSHHLLFEADSSAAAAVLTSGAVPGVLLCRTAYSCMNLSWADGRLVGVGFVKDSLKESVTASAYERVLQAADTVKLFLETTEAAALSSQQLAAFLGRTDGVDIQVFDVGNGSRVVAMPPNVWKAPPLLVQSGSTIHMEVPAAGAVERWASATVTESHGIRWLLVYGRSLDQAAFLLYKWNGLVWEPVDALSETMTRSLGPSVQIRYRPGQTAPVRGLHIRGGGQLTVTPLVGGQGFSVCEQFFACASYRLDSGMNRWVLD